MWDQGGQVYKQLRQQQRISARLVVQYRGGVGATQTALKALGALQGPSQAERDLPSLRVGSRLVGVSGEAQCEFIGLRAHSKACWQHP